MKKTGLLLTVFTMTLSSQAWADPKPFRAALSLGKTMILPDKGADDGAAVELNLKYGWNRYVGAQVLVGTKLWDSYYNTKYFGAEAVFVPLHLDSNGVRDFFELELGAGVTNMTRTVSLGFLPSASLRLTLNTLEGALPVSIGTRIDSMSAFLYGGIGFVF